MSLFIYSCAKKQTDADIDIGFVSTVPDNLLQAAKDYEAQQTQIPTTLSINTAVKRSILQPNWKEASLQTLNNGAKQIVVSSPVIGLDPKSKQGVVRKFVYNTVNNQITGGKIVEIFGGADYMLSSKSNLIEKYTDGNVSDFTGVAINYDLKYTFLSSDVYKNGVKQRAKAYISGDNRLKSKAKGTSAITTLDDCLQYYLTLTYWDQNGIPYDQEVYYLYTLCSGSGDGGSEYGNGTITGGGGGGSSGQVSGPGDHALTNKNNLPPAYTTDTQVYYLCVFKTMEWVSKYLGTPILSGTSLLAYSQLVGNFDAYSYGLPPSQLTTAVSIYFNYNTTTSVANAIDSNHPVMGTIDNGSHEVMITGYNNSGTYTYFDPQLGYYKELAPSGFTNIITITGFK